MQDVGMDTITLSSDEGESLSITTERIDGRLCVCILVYDGIAESEITIPRECFDAILRQFGTMH